MNIIKNIDLTITHIAHIADVHIRNVQRHSEYEQVFEKLYSSLRLMKKNHNNMIIYLGGDIVHAKLDMSPELITVTYKFLKSCADIAPTFLILGNHDCNLNNKSRMDALTPIVNTIDHPNLIFCKDTGIYRTNNLDFVVWSVLDEFENYMVPTSENKQILLYHGPVDTALTEQGMQLKNPKITVDLIDQFDYALLGDIHKYQYLNGNKTIAYCGSTIQQNFGEFLKHGYILWDLEKEKSSFMEIKNDYGYYTLEIHNGMWDEATLPSSFCKYPTIRIKSYDTPQSDLTKQVSALRTKCIQDGISIKDIKVQKISTKNEPTITKTLKTGDIRDIEYQNKLILDYLQKNTFLSDEVIDDIVDINRQLNSNIDISKTIKNIMWVPLKFEFSNMFSYGEDNEINFNQMDGIYGLFANNASGKSSILDALAFCLFDTCSRTFKASEVLNNKKDSFHCKFTFEIHNQIYVIERQGIKDKKGHVKVNVDFYTYSDNTVVTLNGKDRAGTNSVIREYIGNYDEFILTSLSLQNNNSNFVDKQQRERKDLLMQFLDLNVFEELNEYASKESNQIKALIKDFTKQDYPTKIAEATNTKLLQSELVKKYENERKNLLDKLNFITESIIDSTKLLKPIDTNISHLNEQDILFSIDDYYEKNNKCNEKIAEFIAYKNENIDKLNDINSYFKRIDLEELKSKAITEKNIKDNLSELQVSLDKIKLHIQNNIQKQDLLKSHEYDPLCEYCIKNEFVKDALSAKDELDILYKDEKNIKTKIEDLHIQLDVIAGSIKKLEEYNNNLFSVEKIEKVISDTDNKIKEIELLKIKIEASIDDAFLKLEIFKQNKETIELNKKIQTRISELQNEKNLLEKDIDLITTELMNANAQVKVHENLIKIAKDEIHRISQLERKYTAYELYLKATNRNGVPYDLISDILPQIEAHTNEILSYLVDFTVLLESDGKNINIYLSYDDTKIWPLELASGMERFISSIAIRNALINYSNLPRPNFIAIDEGFGVLDSENIAAVYNMFQYLKEHYKFILIISHIDSLKDIAEKQIEIYKNDGFSNVFF